MPVKLGDLLLREKLVSPEQLQEALEQQATSGRKLGSVLVELGFVEDEDITGLLARQSGLSAVDLDRFEVDPAILRIVSPETARTHQVLPLSRAGATLTLAVADPAGTFAFSDIKSITGYNIEPVVASETKLEAMIERCYGPEGTPREVAPGDTGNEEQGHPSTVDPRALTIADMAGFGGLSEIDLDAMAADEADPSAAAGDLDEIDLVELSRSTDAAPVVKLTNVLIVDAFKRRATDIHIEPYEEEFRVRFRIDGILYNVMALPPQLKDALTSRIKIMGNLDIAKKRRPQEGRIKIKMRIEDRARDLDFRVSCLPTLWGETIVMRRLGRPQLMLDMTRMGFEPLSLERFQGAINRPYGIVLVTGPNGSGKSNTLYSALTSLNRPDLNIVAAEDPVEYTLAGINQVRIGDRTGLTHAEALRLFLGQDPDVVFVNPLRDHETIEMVVKTALGGRLVMAGMEGVDAPSVIDSLREAVETSRLLVSSLARALRLVLSQRLIRRVCTDCRTVADVPAARLVELGFSQDEAGDVVAYTGPGCERCNGTGYNGRVGLFEVLQVTDAIRHLVRAGAPASEIRHKALEEGMISLHQSGLEKIRAGVTSVEEVAREVVG